MPKTYYTIRQAYTFSGDPIGYYAQSQWHESQPVIWRGKVVYQYAYTAKVETRAYLMEHKNVPLFQWKDVQEEEDTLPADVFAYAYVEEG